ncbi:MarR family transcriptional regulator [Uruburuella suis]|uniref:MarR family transcriptional regulator n=1 Tax=Uruburuella suis TaxID=252130 RepID=A0AAE9GYN7_9NEIS|nr:MarR family transcriptional regulator [Uruburuella suis]TCP06436.1 DNA-binding MarR family transcriptional regulator [Uruburuella suis]UOO80230.1 MarR family transcriptional regulator [Uruburuella suis]
MAQQERKEKDLIDELIMHWHTVLPDLDTGGTETIGRIVRLNYFISRELEANLSHYQLNIGEFNVLAALRRKTVPHQLTAGQLQGLVMISSGGLTNRINRLEARGLIVRLPDKNDRRGVIVQLTGEGKKLIESAAPTHLNVEKSLASPLSQAEQTQLSMLLKKLLLAYESNA